MSTVNAAVAGTVAQGGWVDGKRAWWLLSPALPLIGVVSMVAVLAGAPGAALWALLVGRNELRADTPELTVPHPRMRERACVLLMRR